jgi:hypothetical protein
VSPALVIEHFEIIEQLGLGIGMARKRSPISR